MPQAPILLSKFRRRLRWTLRITSAWIVLSAFSALYECNVVVGMGATPDKLSIFAEHLSRAFIGGLLLGGAYMFLLHDRLRKLSFAKGCGIVTGLVFAGVALYHLLPPAFSGRPQDIPGSAWEALGHFLYWALLMGGTMAMLRLNEQYGIGSWSYLLNGYFRPRQELRIFMFLDMRSSTMVAEAIGDTRYFKLLNELYADITEPVIYSEGEVYQYVGDEISVSWHLQRGVRNHRCIRCFFAIREKLRKRADHYRETYGTVPVFKAGFHFGRVTSGEVGMVKRQTIFSGDVVNTAARIQASCNAMGVDNLVSKELMDVLSLKTLPYTVKPIGAIPLKGKRNAVELFTLSLPGEGQ